jgi:GntR family transcriptional regulator/MocR family aminotransferase
VTPAHQFPVGMPMSLARRHALLARAAALGAIVIEDDYDSDFRVGGTPLHPLQSLDPHGLVAYVGTFSKVLAPELRLGYVIAPPALRQAITSAKYLSDGHTPSMNQWTLAKFMADGLLPRHVRRCHAVYQRRREAILRRFETDLAPWFELVPAVAGFHLAALCRQPLDTALLSQLCRRVEVGLYPIDDFFHDQPARPGLLLGYGAIDLLDIDPSLDRVRAVLQQMTA